MSTTVRTVQVVYSANPAPFVAGTTKAAASAKGLATQTAATNAQLAGTGGAARRAGGGLGIMSAKFLGPAGLIAGMANAGGAATDFEASAAKLQSQIGLSADAAGQLADASRQVGVQMGVGAQEAVDASFFIASAGLRGEDAMEALEYSAGAAAIGLGETSNVADLLTSAMNAYGPEALNAANATDILIGAVKEGKAEAPELTSAMGAILPIASEMGVEFNEVSAAISSMTRTGSSASEAVTSLQGILVGILRPSEQAAQAFEEMGIPAARLREVIAEDPEMGLFNALTMITDAADGNVEVLGELFPRVQGMRGIMDLMGESTADTAATFEELADATGNYDEALAITEETTRFKIDQMKAHWEEFRLEAGGVVAEFAGPILSDMNRSLDDSTHSAMDWIGTFTGNAGAAGRTWTKVGEDIATALGWVDESADDAAGSVDGLERSTTIGAGAMDRLASAATGSAEEMHEAATSIDAYLEAVARAEDPVLQLRDAISRVDAAEREYQEALEEHGPKSDEAADASWGVYEAVSAAQQAAINGDLSFGEFSARLDLFVERGWISKDMADTLKGSVDGLRESSEAYEGDYNADFYANTAEAEAALERVRRAVGAIPTQRMIDISVRHGAGASPSGLATFHHDGGMAGEGPEQPFNGLKPNEVGPLVLEKGEYVVNKRATAKHASLLDAINADRMHDGGSVGGAATGSSSADIAHTLDQLSAKIAAFDTSIAARDRNERHQDLREGVRDARSDLDSAEGADERRRARERLADATERLTKFERDHREQVERTRLEEEKARLETELRIAQNREAFEFDQMSTSEQIADLDRRIAAEQEFTDEWMRLTSQRDRLADQVAQKEARRARERSDNLEQWVFENEMSTSEQAAWLDEQIEAEQTYTDEWMRLSNQRQRLLDQETTAARQAADQQMDILKGMLEERDRLLQQQQQAEERRRSAIAASDAQWMQNARAENQRHADAITDIQKRAAQQADDILAARRSELASGLELGPELDAASIAGQLEQNVDDLHEWSDGLDELRDAGLSEDVIELLGLGRGPEALGQVLALLDSGQRDIDRLNEAAADRQRELDEQVASEREDSASQLARDLFAIEEESNRKLEEERAEHHDTLMGLYDDHLERVKEANAEFEEEHERLAEEMAAIGEETGRGWAEAIAEGIESEIPAIEAQVRKVQDLLAQANAAEAAAADVGVASFDSGGILKPGLSLAYNGTGRDEHVLTGAQLKAVASSGSPVRAEMAGGDGRISDAVTHRKLDEVTNVLKAILDDSADAGEIRARVAAI